MTAPKDPSPEPPCLRYLDKGKLFPNYKRISMPKELLRTGLIGPPKTVYWANDCKYDYLTLSHNMEEFRDSRYTIYGETKATVKLLFVPGCIVYESKQELFAEKPDVAAMQDEDLLSGRGLYLDGKVYFAATDKMLGIGEHARDDMRPTDRKMYALRADQWYDRHPLKS